MSFANIKKAEEVSKQPVPEPIYPKEEDVRPISNIIQKFKIIRQPPTDVTADTNTAKSIVLRWKETTNATEYRVEMKKSNESDFHEIYRGANTTTTVGDLKEEGKHQFRVCAVYGSEISGWSRVVKAKPWILRAPQNIAASSDIGDTIKVSWNEVNSPANNLVSYQVEVQPAGDPFRTKSYSSEKTSIIERGLDAGREYVARVRSVCGNSSSEWGKVVSIKTKVPKCLIGHNLVPYDIEEYQRRGLIGTISCDNCKNLYQVGSRGIFYGCRICDYDLCPECIKKPMHLQRRECAKGHPLTLVTLGGRLAGRQYNGVNCDICRKININTQTYPVNYLILYCPLCEYDVCHECVQRYEHEAH